MAGGSWALAEELFARGDPAFVAELRCIHDADRLGKFAGRWLADKRPAARQLLIAYLSLPLNAYRHEALVKRLFKGAEAAGDDELMGVFLVAFDRSIRRARRKQTHYKWEQCATRAQAEFQARVWELHGFQARISDYSNRFYITAQKTEEVIVAPSNPMPRPRDLQGPAYVADQVRPRLERRFILFSLPTRRYLRRRAWRYFRKLGKSDPERYRTAAISYLQRYTDSDVDTDIHLLDNWGLVHTLFFDSPVLVRPAEGWKLAPGESLSDLAPAPRFPAVWTDAPEALLTLLMKAQCRTVRLWAARMLQAFQPDWLKQQPVETFLKLIDHADPNVAALGFELLENHPDLASVPVESWLSRLEGDDLDKLERLSALLARRLDPRRLALGQNVRLAQHRSLPVARLGFTLLQGRPALDEADVPELLPLVQAECETLRADIVAWLRQQLMQMGPPRAEWLLEFLDSKYADVRAAGWAWLRETPLQEEPAIWQKLLESPYDDVKGPLIAELGKRSIGASPDAVRMLWAGVLLNIYGGGRRKPGVVSQIVARVDEHPDEAHRLLALLAVAVRSLRGPEFRTGLAGVVSLFERNADLRAAIVRHFPELVLPDAEGLVHTTPAM
jgi:hypothetical protein